ncbi:MAG: helix-turn-helix transcriptional regulator, partial [Acidimicrobiia bacterium]
AGQLVTEAMSAHDAVPHVAFEAARTRLLAGSILRRAGRRTAARVELESARSTFSILGAAPFVARVDAELARLATRRAPEGLTGTERRVAELAGAGMTNAEIAASMSISVRTVESNLTRVYRKLGVRSRTELAARTAPV